MAKTDRHPNWSGEGISHEGDASTRRPNGTDPSSAPRDVDSDARRRVFADRYEVISLLGTGSMGTVYEVRDRELDETVALKVLRAELAFAPEAIERFRREVKLARRVTHGNIARVFDIGQCGESRFLTMEYIAGQSLAELVKGRGIATTRLVEIVKSIASGLAAAHAASVVHHDLKPENVLISSHDGRVIVTDFGIARALEQVPLHGGTRTTQHSLIGSPAYSAPERAAGLGSDPRSDLYSLGVLFYEALTGCLPTRIGSHVRGPNVEVGRELAKRRPGLAPWLVAIVERCLAPSPDDRFATANEVVEALSDVAPSSTPRASSKAPIADIDDPKHRARRAARRGFAVGFTEAVELYRELVDRDRDDPMVLAGLASASLWQWFFSGTDQHRIEGERALERALRVAPESLDVRLVTVQRLWSLGRPREAAVACGALLDSGDSLELCELLGFLLREAGMNAAARTELEKALRIDPASFASNMELSRLSALEGDWASADRFLDRVMRPADTALAAGRRRFGFRMALWRRDFTLARELMAAGEPTLGSLDVLYRLVLEDESKMQMQQFFKDADRRDASPRAVATLRQIEAELACMQGDVEWAILAVSRAMEAGLVDSLWLTNCPLLEVVRHDPRSAKLIFRMAERAKMVRDVYESVDLVGRRERGGVARSFGCR